MSELDARSSLGFLFGTDSRSTRGLLWESVELLLKHDFLAPRVVHVSLAFHTAALPLGLARCVSTYWRPGQFAGVVTINRIALNALVGKCVTTYMQASCIDYGPLARGGLIIVPTVGKGVL